MKTKALTSYQTPKYPTKKEVLQQPGLLRRCENERWQKIFGAGISGVLLTGISLAGYDKLVQVSIAKSSSDTNAVQDVNSSQKAKSTKQAKARLLVAPLFEHGQGRGSTGCVAISPPMFLSEEEALVIIKEELAKNGVILNKERVTIKDINITPGKYEGFGSFSSKLKDEPLVMDLNDPNKAISVEFISSEDYHRFGGERSSSTVQSYDFIKVANELRRQLNSDAKDGIYGVFYEPGAAYDIWEDTNTPPEKRWEKIKEQAYKSARESLREQVQDFAKWLKSEKVI
jgi:hypothetical protein